MTVDEVLPEGISRSEHDEILRSVDAILTDRASAPTEPVTRRRRASGMGSILLLNGILAILLAGSLYAYVRFVPRSAVGVNLLTGDVQTSAGAVVGEVQEQNRQALSDREQQIARIERELAALRATRSGTGTANPQNDIRAAELEQQLQDLNASAAERISARTRSEEQISFLALQLNGLYGQMNDALATGNYEQARAALEQASGLVQTPAFLNDPVLGAAISAISEANSVLAAALPVAQAEANELARFGAQLEEANALVQQADARFEEGQLENAEALYRSALRTISAAERAAAQLISIQTNRISSDYEQRIATLQRSLATERQARSTLARQVETLQTTRDELSAEVTRLQATVAELQAAAPPEIDLTTVRDRIAAAERSARASIGADTEDVDIPDVVNLLGTRTLLRAVVDSPSMREQYPSLYDDMETYFRALGAARIEEGEEAAYQRAAEALSVMASELGTPTSATTGTVSADDIVDQAAALLERALDLIADQQ